MRHHRHLQQRRGESEGNQGHLHRQSIRRQAQVHSAPTAHARVAPGGGEVSDAFDDDGLFHFEQPGAVAATSAAAAAAPGEDRTDCPRH